MRSHGKVVGQVLALLSVLPPVAGAVTVIETDGGGDRTSVFYVSDARVRVENSARASSVLLFDRTAGELVFIDHDARQYQRVGQEEKRQIARSIERTRDRLEEQIEQMPPEQRKHMRERLAELPGADSAPSVDIERGGSSTAAGIACQEAMVHVNAAPSHAVCVASAEDIGLSPGGFRTLDRMFAFFGEMTAGMSEGKAELGPRTTSKLIRELGGIPVRSEAVESGTTWSVVSVHETSLPPERFRVPQDYSEVDPVARQNRP